MPRGGFMNGVIVGMFLCLACVYIFFFFLSDEQLLQAFPSFMGNEDARQSHGRNARQGDQDAGGKEGLPAMYHSEWHRGSLSGSQPARMPAHTARRNAPQPRPTPLQPEGEASPSTEEHGPGPGNTPPPNLGGYNATQRLAVVPPAPPTKVAQNGWKYRRHGPQDYPSITAIRHAHSAAKGKKVAYIINILSEPDRTMIDAAAVLAKSIATALTLPGVVFTEHVLIAFVPSEPVNASRSSKRGARLGPVGAQGKVFRPVSSASVDRLERLGYRVMARGAPVDPERIPNDFMREHMPRDGCCGEKELIKLHAWNLTDYHRAVLLDLDTLLLRSLDELIAMDKELVFTPDPQAGGAQEAVPPFGGGFLVVRPNPEALHHMISIAQEGDYHPGTGWGGSRIGWWAGGKTVQGLLPYYYKRVLADKEASYEADKCVFNVAFDSPECLHASASHSPAGPPAALVHFAGGCGKPWGCSPRFRSAQCQVAIRKWMELRREAEASLGLKAVRACPSPGKYAPMAFE